MLSAQLVEIAMSFWETSDFSLSVNFQSVFMNQAVYNGISSGRFFVFIWRWKSFFTPPERFSWKLLSSLLLAWETHRCMSAMCARERVQAHNFPRTGCSLVRTVWILHGTATRACIRLKSSNSFFVTESRMLKMQKNCDLHFCLLNDFMARDPLRLVSWITWIPWHLFTLLFRA